MRLPIPPYGFVTGPSLVDWRPLEDEGQDTVFFLTVTQENIAGGTFNLRQVDVTDEVTSLDVEQVTSLPVRGPIELRVGVPGNSAGRGVGFLDDGAPDTETGLQPVGSSESTYYTPLVFDTVGAGQAATLCEVGEEQVNLTVVIATETDDEVNIYYTPNGESISTAINAPSASNGFQRVLDRIPLVGPGVVTLSVDVVTGPVVIYAWLSR